MKSKATAGPRYKCKDQHPRQLWNGGRRRSTRSQSSTTWEEAPAQRQHKARIRSTPPRLGSLVPVDVYCSTCVVVLYWKSTVSKSGLRTICEPCILLLCHHDDPFSSSKTNPLLTFFSAFKPPQKFRRAGQEKREKTKEREVYEQGQAKENGVFCCNEDAPKFTLLCDMRGDGPRQTVKQRTPQNLVRATNSHWCTGNIT